MPTPVAGESRDDWMERCVPEVVQEGSDPDQAVAICASMWEDRNAMKHMTTGLEIKSLDEGGSFSGYASVFGIQDLDGDVIVKGAFGNTLRKARETNRMPKMLWQHDTAQIIGKWQEMTEDDRGLHVKGSLILDVERGREAYALMKAGVLDGMSVGFNIRDAGRSEGGRVIEEVDLWEVSLVTWGANQEARISNVKAKDSIRDFEAFLRDAGFSRTESKAIAAKGFRAFDQRDAGDDGPDYESLIKQINDTAELLRI